MLGQCDKCGSNIDFSKGIPFSILKCAKCGAEFIVPKLFDKYQLVEIIEEFSIFKKYKAYELDSDKVVEIVIMDSHFNGYRDCIIICRNETVKFISLNNNPDIVSVLEYGEHEGSFYFTSPYFESFKLSDYNREVLKEFEVDSVIKVFRKVGEILGEYHLQGFCHHNISPENIIIDENDNIMLQNALVNRIIYSFESVSHIESSASSYYISPEKAENGKEDEMGDVFSLGVAMYYMLTGCYPFDGEDRDEIVYSRIKRKSTGISQKIRSIPYRKPVGVDMLRNDIPIEWSELLNKLLHPYPVLRLKLSQFISELIEIRK